MNNNQTGIDLEVLEPKHLWLPREKFVHTPLHLHPTTHSPERPQHQRLHISCYCVLFSWASLLLHYVPPKSIMMVHAPLPWSSASLKKAPDARSERHFREHPATGYVPWRKGRSESLRNQLLRAQLGQLFEFQVKESCPFHFLP